MKELWRRQEGNPYSPHMSVDDEGYISMTLGSLTIRLTIEQWHQAGDILFCDKFHKSRWKLWLVKLLMK